MQLPTAAVYYNFNTPVSTPTLPVTPLEEPRDVPPDGSPSSEDPSDSHRTSFSISNGDAGEDPMMDLWKMLFIPSGQPEPEEPPSLYIANEEDFARIRQLLLAK